MSLIHQLASGTTIGDVVPVGPLNPLEVVSSGAKPSSAAANAVTTTATTAAAGSLILKASAGNLYGFNVAAGASAGYLLIYDSATVPADGATQPKQAYAVAANATLARSFEMPRAFSNGITLVFSTTGPFTKTISATAFLSGEAV